MSEPQLRAADFPTDIPNAPDLTLAIYEITKALARANPHLDGTWVDSVEWTRGESLIVRGNGWDVVYESKG